MSEPNLKIMNFIIFGGTMLIVLASWGMSVWCFFYIPIASAGMILASMMCTFSWISFIKKSKLRQELLNE